VIPARAIPFAFVLLWSSSFVAVQIGLRHLSPLLFVAVRLVLCAAVLSALVAWRGVSVRAIGWRRAGHCAIAGVLMNGIGLMVPHVGLTMTTPAPIALVQSLTPLLSALLGMVLLDGRLRARQWLGLVLGFAGVAAVAAIAAAQSARLVEGMALGLVGVVSFVSGTIWFGRYCRGVPLLAGAWIQFLAAAGAAVLGAALLETRRWDFSAGAIGAVAWNAGAVSLGGMGLYVLMLRDGTAARTTANFYLVPGTTALLTWLALGDRLTAPALGGFVVAGIGCWLVSGGAWPKA
jgi:drug/metabolite transporter (DMT)-like permease